MRIALFAVALALCLGVAPTHADEGSKPVTDKERDAAIDKALKYLDKEVLKLPHVHGTPRKQFTVAAYGVVKLLARPFVALIARNASSSFANAADARPVARSISNVWRVTA